MQISRNRESTPGSDSAKHVKFSCWVKLNTQSEILHGDFLPTSVIFFFSLQNLLSWLSITQRMSMTQHACNHGNAQCYKNKKHYEAR